MEGPFKLKAKEIQLAWIAIGRREESMNVCDGAMAVDTRIDQSLELISRIPVKVIRKLRT